MAADNIYLGYHVTWGGGILCDVITQPDTLPKLSSLTSDISDITGTISKGHILANMLEFLYSAYRS
jgi:hypothetical protein